jgi:hypothetical protein
MTPAARRTLEQLAADESCDLLQDGIHAYCGTRPVASRVVSELRWSSAIRPLVPSDEPGPKYYTISDMGRHYLRRPELEQEYFAAVRAGRGPFTIKDDRIVPLTGAD